MKTIVNLFGLLFLSFTFLLGCDYVDQGAPLIEEPPQESSISELQSFSQELLDNLPEIEQIESLEILTSEEIQQLLGINEVLNATRFNSNISNEEFIKLKKEIESIGDEIIQINTDVAVRAMQKQIPKKQCSNKANSCSGTDAEIAVCGAKALGDYVGCLISKSTSTTLNSIR